jgi:hypothetical protein
MFTRHYFNGQPIEDGTPVMVKDAGGQFWTGRYSWSGNPDEPPALDRTDGPRMILTKDIEVRTGQQVGRGSIEFKPW